ncbi:DUF2570 domain-containing protein [Cedecea neteri]|uniref:DUF2570 domain-containing protein n=1 Tax=Cedecea neteri TaxID=158822 RepID=UPI002AA88D7E|nr:DUF2570 domain-containing protein [Cedecea neteri]WPU24985.1 DUF2570 domain-containing protein [Cedecea neteri]
MNWPFRALLTLFLLSLAGGLIWSANHYHGKYLAEQRRAESAEQQANAAQTITSNVLLTVSIFNSITEANQHAKEQIALDASGAARDIQMAVAGDDCRNRPVSAGAVKRLHDYANGLRQSAGGSAASQSGG